MTSDYACHVNPVEGVVASLCRSRRGLGWGGGRGGEGGGVRYDSWDAAGGLKVLKVREK